jgi:hypothetical protein
MKLFRSRHKRVLLGEILRAFGTLNIMCAAKRDHEDIRHKANKIADKFNEYLKYD